MTTIKLSDYLKRGKEKYAELEKDLVLLEDLEQSGLDLDVDGDYLFNKKRTFITQDYSVADTVTVDKESALSMLGISESIIQKILFEINFTTMLPTSQGKITVHCRHTTDRNIGLARIDSTEYVLTAAIAEIYTGFFNKLGHKYIIKHSPRSTQEFIDFYKEQGVKEKLLDTLELNVRRLREEFPEQDRKIEHPELTKIRKSLQIV